MKKRAQQKRLRGSGQWGGRGKREFRRESGHLRQMLLKTWTKWRHWSLNSAKTGLIKDFPKIHFPQCSWKANVHSFLFIVSIFINQVLLCRQQRILLFRMIFQKWVLFWSQIFCFTANYHPLIFLRVAIHVAGIFLFFSFSYRTLIPLSNIPNHLVYLKSLNLFSIF